MSCNWSKLVEQGRAKAFGVSWNEDELHAIYKLKIPVDFVRRGFLTLESYEKAQSDVEEKIRDNGESPIWAMNKKQLEEKAKQMGISITVGMNKKEFRDAIELELNKQQ